MRKFITLTAAFLIGVASAFAVPVKPSTKTITQSDGTKVTIHAVGDEWAHGYVTSDFKTVGIGKDGDVYYKTTNGLSTVRAHDIVQRNASELDFLSKNQSIIGLNARKIANKRSKSPNLLGGPMKVGSTQVPTTGTPRVPVIVVEFSDKHCSNPISTFSSTYTSGSNSVYQYFYDQSNGLYQPQYDVYGIYRLNKSRATYGANENNDPDGSDVGVAQMVYDAVIASNADIDWTNYDNDGDGEADVVIVVYAGIGEAQAYGEVLDAVWPCQWTLASGAYYGDGPGSVTLDGIKIDRFGVFNEIIGNDDNGTVMDGIGTFCHEFSHCLGLPDFYETTYAYGYYGMGNWDLMCSGNYNNNGYTPIGYNAYEKNFMGWLELLSPTANHQYTLPKFNQKNASTDIAYKITSPVNPNEYYVLENRAKQGWDTYIKDEGMMITHVSYISDRWTNNTVNNNAVQLFTIIPADNKWSTNNENADLWGETKHELTDDSTPDARLYLTSSGSATSNAGHMGQPLTEINLNSDGTVSFWYMKGVSNYSDPVLLDADNISDTSFTARWTDDTPAADVLSYDLQVNINDGSGPTLLNEEDLSSGNVTNWTKSTSGTYNDASNNGGLRLGTTNAIGSITSPELDLSSGTVTVKVNCKYYGSDSSAQLKVSVLNASGTTLTSTTISPLTSSMADYSVKLTGSFTSSSKIKLENVTKGKRVVVSNVKVYDGDATASNAPIRASESGDANSRTITGITNKYYTVTGLTAGATYDFKVRANYADQTSSDWTNTKSVTLLGELELNPFIVATDALAFGDVSVNQSSTLAIEIIAEQLKGDVTLTLNDANNVFALASSTVTKAEAEAGTDVNVTFTPAAAQAYSATVTISSEDADDVVVALSGNGLPVKEVPHFIRDAFDVENTSFSCEWNDVDYVSSYTLDVTRVGGGGGDENYVYALVNDVNNLSDGDHIIIVNASKGKAAGEIVSGTNPYLAAVDVTISNDAISEISSDVTEYTLEESADGWLLATSDGQYLTSTAAKKMSYTASGSVVTISISSGNATIDFGSSVGKILYNVSSPRFTTYTSNPSATMLLPQIYKRVAVPANEAISGDEAHKVITGITDTNYNVDGLTAGATYTYKVKAVYLDQTESEWSDEESVTLTDVVNPTIFCNLTSVNFGTIYTGQSDSATFFVSGENLSDDIAISLEFDGENCLTVNPFSVSVADAVDGFEITITYAPTEIGDFYGIITLSSEGAEDVLLEVIGNADIERGVPEISVPTDQEITTSSFTASWSAVPNVESYTLEVLQTSSGGGSGEETYAFVPVADVNDLNDGDQIIIVSTSEGRAAGPLSSQILMAEQVTIADNVISEISDDVTVFTLEASGDGWLLANSEGQYLTSTTAKKMSYTANGTVTSISISSGNATISFGSSVGKILYNVNSPRFTTYTSNPTAVMLLPQIYKLAALPANNAHVRDYEPMTFTDITDTSYTVNDLEAGASYSYRVKAIYIDDSEGDWSESQSVTIKNSTGVDAVIANGAIVIANGTVTVADGVKARVYTISGVEVAANGNNRWSLRPGVYVVATGTTARKIIVR